MPVLAAETDLGPVPTLHLPAGCATCSCSPGDTVELAWLYFRAYPPGEASASLEEAQADIAASFAGAYGDLLPAASPMVHCAGVLAAAVLTVRRATWDNAPSCPYIIEVFTAPEQRRLGQAGAVLQTAMTALHASSEQQVALSMAAKMARPLRSTPAWDSGRHRAVEGSQGAGT